MTKSMLDRKYMGVSVRARSRRGDGAVTKGKRGGAQPGAGRPPLPEGDARTHRVAVLLNDRELARLKRAAGDQPLSDYIREHVLEAAYQAAGY